MSDQFERLVDVVLAEGAVPQPSWTEGRVRLPGRGALGLKLAERRISQALRNYWGPGADPLRVQLALEDARFVAGIVRMLGDQLHLTNADRRRVASALARHRVLDERDDALAEVDDAWQAWWPPAPGDEGRATLARFLGAWRAFLGRDG